MNHGKKMVAPIVITVLLVVYYLGAGILFLIIPDIPILAKVLMIVIPTLLAGVMVSVLISRIREIKGGEEDDLSEY